MTETAGSPRRAVKQIKKSRTKDGQTEYLVVYEGAEAANAVWIPEAKVDPPALLDAFREKRGSKPNPSAASRPPGTRQLKEIRGVIPEGDSWKFVVRFSDSPKDEAVSRADMRASYPKQLAKFYEAHLQPGNQLTSLN
jgi:hypothetical protein